MRARRAWCVVGRVTRYCDTNLFSDTPRITAEYRRIFTALPTIWLCSLEWGVRTMYQCWLVVGSSLSPASDVRAGDVPACCACDGAPCSGCRRLGCCVSTACDVTSPPRRRGVPGDARRRWRCLRWCRRHVVLVAQCG